MRLLASFLQEAFVHRRIAILLAALTAAPPGSTAAQRFWAPQVGIQGGLARVSPTGTGGADRHVDFLDVPGFGDAYASLYFVAPIAGRWALEPSLVAFQGSFLDNTGVFPSAGASQLLFSLRANFALSRHFYLAAGGNVVYQEAGGIHDTQLGVEGGFGARLAPGARTEARMEGRMAVAGKTDFFAPVAVYGLLFGVATRLDGGGGPAAARRQGWVPALGVAGGYARTHFNGSSFGLTLVLDGTTFALPGSGVTTPATFFAIVPVTGRWAIEPAVDLHRDQGGGVTSFDGHASTRVNYLIRGGWYGALGGNVRYVQSTGTKGFALLGAQAATGYQFALLTGVRLRVEASFTTFAPNRASFPFTSNTFALLGGVLFPLR